MGEIGAKRILIILLLSTAWIFGPVTPGEVEVRAGSAYSQGTAVANNGSTLSSRKTQAILGLEFGITGPLSAGVSVPFEWAQNINDGVVFYRRSEVADLRFELRTAPSPSWHIALTASVPGHDSDSALSQRFPASQSLFPEIGRGEVTLGTNWAYRHRTTDVTSALRFALATGLSERSVVTSIDAFAGLKIGGGWLTVGPTLGAEVSTAGSGSERVRFGIMERIGEPNGPALELSAHADVMTDEVEPSAGVIATLVWRR